jgi:hypothetical protein
MLDLGTIQTLIKFLDQLVAVSSVDFADFPDRFLSFLHFADVEIPSRRFNHKKSGDNCADQ